MESLSGKVAVVAGADSCIGLAAAKAFARQGAHVIVTGRHQAAMRAAVAEIGGTVVGVVGDVADMAHHCRLAELVRERFGGVDVYLAHAGVSTLTASGEASPEAHNAEFAANTRGLAFGVQQMLPLVRDGGSIILAGSIARKTSPLSSSDF